MKKIACLFLALASAVALWAETEGTVAVDEGTLNARKAPEVKAPALMKLPKGTKVTIIRRCGDNWLEIAVPQDAPVYVDEAYVVGGKASRDLRMYNGKGREHAVWGELKKGEAVTLLDDRARGWVRIAPPERLRLYVVALYIDGAEAVPMTEKAEARSGDKPAEAAPAAVPAAKPAAKPEAKPAEKKPAAKPAEKKPAEKKPAAKPAAKPAEKKPAAKPAAKPAEKKPAAKPAAKPAEKKPAAKPAAKPAEKKTTAKPAAKPAPVKIDAALKELSIKETDKGKAVTRTGILCVASDNFKAASFSLVDDRNENIGFVYYPGKASVLKKLVDKKVTVHGVEFKVPTWKNPVIVVQSLEEVR